MKEANLNDQITFEDSMGRTRCGTVERITLSYDCVDEDGELVTVSQYQILRVER